MTKEEIEKRIPELEFLLKKDRMFCETIAQYTIDWIKFLLTSLTEMEERVKELEIENKAIVERSESGFFRLEQAESSLTKLKEAVDRHRTILTRQMEIGEIDEELYRTRDEVNNL